MSYEERAAWVQGIVAVIGYGIYVAVILSRASGSPLADAPYVDAMLWTIGSAIVAGILGGIVVGISTRGRTLKDQRDRQIYRHGESIGQSFVVIGALGALILAWFEIDWFWIANLLYLCFVLSAILSWIVKAVAYKRGLPEW
ncbi:MAG: hypothetical protein M3Y46_03600 [Actinomycetota bacterium]|nr:hypothetical protein [Actinomycetota bacterium]